jgi:enoyl-[acyl-carrier protein] reductase I
MIAVTTISKGGKVMFSIDLTGKKYLVCGVANERSICWAIVKALRSAGATVILTYLPIDDKRLKKLVDLAASEDVTELIPCNFYEEASIKSCFEKLATMGPFAGAVHGIAFSDKDQLNGPFIDVTRENFMNTMMVSCYSFIELAREVSPLMLQGGSIITLSFDASRGTYPNYNVMALAKSSLETGVRYLATDLGVRNIRVNTLSPSPERTLAAAGISNFNRIGDFAEGMSPLGRRATMEEIGNTALFLLSDMSSGIDGQTILVDCGASSTIMPSPRHAAKMAQNFNEIAKIVGTSNDQKVSE